MKKVIIILSFLFLTNSSNAQSFMDTSNIWTVFHISFPGGNIFYDHLTYKFTGDTTLGAYQYQLLRWSYDSTFLSPNFAGAWREDSLGRIFINNLQLEYMIYDFSLALNDTFNFDPTMGGPIELVVDSVDYIVLLNGESRKRLFFNLSTTPEIWIEGIGSTKAPNRMAYNYYPNVDYYTLVCFTEKDTLKFLNTDFQNCYFNPWVIGQNEFNIEPEIYFSPNPCNTICNLKIKGLTTPYEISIFDIYGKICFAFHKSFEEYYSINVNNLNSGIYFYHLTDANHNIKNGKFIIE